MNNRIKAIEQKGNNNIGVLKSNESIDFDNKFLENFKKINYYNSQQILQNLKSITENIIKNLIQITSSMMKNYKSTELLDNQKQAVGDILISLSDTKLSAKTILSELEKNNINNINNINIIYLRGLFKNMFELHLKNREMLNNYLISEFESNANLFEQSKEKNIEKDAYSKQFCFEIINKLSIMLNTNNVIEVLINLKNKKNFLKTNNFIINNFIRNIVDFQSKVLEYKEYKLKCKEYKLNSIEILKYHNISKEIENNISEYLNSVVVNYSKDSKEIKIIEEYKEFFENIRKEIYAEVFDSFLKI